MNTRIEIFYKPNLDDPIGNRLKTEIETLGFNMVQDVRVSQVYMIESALSEQKIKDICEQLLADSITQDYLINSSQLKNNIQNCHIVEVSRKSGVMDPVEPSVLKGIQDMGLEAAYVKTAKKYMITGEFSNDQLKIVADKILANSTIEDISFGSGSYTCVMQVIDSELKLYLKKNIIDLLSMDDKDLMEISRNFTLSLNLLEMKAIQKHFSSIERNPSDIELETIAQTWSEHCVHKTLKGNIEYNGTIIKNLLASTIVKATTELNKPWCVSVFEDNAGIMRFNDEYNICFKVETHNHPSAIEPYGGAGTGIGGVIRDILGTGLGGMPILNTDVFCFGPPDLPQNEVPQGALHPKRVFKGVAAGVRDYGNRMGIPTANGAIFFDKRYVGNPLVFCGTVGLIPSDKCNKEPRKGDLIILVGGRTGRDGIHGVTFASLGLDKDSEMRSSSAVQIGNPITEKKVADVLLEARDKGLYNCITDCGGGGLSSAIGEMGKKLGAKVYLDKIPLKYQGLTYMEIWISEAQERMVMAVPPEKEDEFIAMFQDEDVEAATIGCFTGDKKLHLIFNNETMGILDMEFLHDGLPKILRKAEWKLSKFPEPDLRKAEGKPAARNTQPNYGNDLKKILSSWNVCSKEMVIREYDHEVQGASVLKPLQGIDNDGPGDACVIAPVPGSNRGIIVSNGMNPKYGDIDTYHMTASAIDEALRQIIAVGGSLEQVALLDNFCWGNTEKPECLGNLVRAAQACYDYSLQYGTPFISGKDSLYNEFGNGTETISIPHTLLISAFSTISDVTMCISMDVKKPGNLIYIVGTTKAELGGSHYYHVHGYIGNSVPKVDAKLGKKIMNSLSKASGRKLIRACHDCSEGGLAVAAAEMSFSGGLGMDINISLVPVSSDVETTETILFSESNSRFIVEIEPHNQKEFEDALSSVPFAKLGSVTDNDQFVIRKTPNSIIVSENIYTLKESWQMPLKILGF